jgi:hypothetical protein
VAALTREAEENVRDGDLRYLVSHRSVPYDFLVVVPPLRLLPCTFPCPIARRCRSSTCRLYPVEASDLGLRLGARGSDAYNFCGGRGLVVN